MSRKKKRTYTLGKRLDKAYDNYVKRYNKKREEMNKKGFEMADRQLNFSEYKAVREALTRDGIKININQTLVSEQAYVYSLKTARNLRKFAKENTEKLEGLLSDEQKEVLKLKENSIENVSIDKLRQGEGLTTYLASVNEALNELKENDPDEYKKLMAQLPDNVKHTNQGFISYEVFGSV